MFESWNEPDLRNFNVLAFNYSDYIAYLSAVRAGLHTISKHLQLRGPAGLFRTNRNHPSSAHPLCWGLLRLCNANRSACPIDTLTYHRKGTDGTAASILSGTLALIDVMRAWFPGVDGMPYANSEADPSTGWSHPLPGNANVQYAAALVETVLLHWSARVDATNAERLPHLSDISHDNAFVSYHPFEFEQRTLFARFRMNRTGPPADEQLFEKPVYAAMGMLTAVLLGGAKRAQRVSAPQSTATCMWVVSKNAGDDNRAIANEWYASVLAVSRGSNVSHRHDDREPMRDAIRVRIDGIASGGAAMLWFVEYLEHQLTDPHHVWMANGRPAYPDAGLRAAMRCAQGPFVLIEPQMVSPSTASTTNSSSAIAFTISLRRPWLVAVRICPAQIIAAYDIRSLRARRINAEEVMLVWSLRRSQWRQNRCIRTYQVHYRRTATDEWQPLNQLHNPFMSYHHRASHNQTTHGLYAVQAIDLAGRPGRLSPPIQYTNVNT